MADTDNRPIIKLYLISTHFVQCCNIFPQLQPTSLLFSYTVHSKTIEAENLSSF